MQTKILNLDKATISATERNGGVKPSYVIYEEYNGRVRNYNELSDCNMFIASWTAEAVKDKAKEVINIAQLIDTQYKIITSVTIN
jgi:hypothetical protein